jgi:hypothetical protein
MNLNALFQTLNQRKTMNLSTVKNLLNRTRWFMERGMTEKAKEEMGYVLDAVYELERVLPATDTDTEEKKP